MFYHIYILVNKGENKQHVERPKKTAQKQGGYTVEYQVKDSNESKDHKHDKYPREFQHSKGVPAEPHPLDRRSGTGRG